METFMDFIKSMNFSDEEVAKKKAVDEWGRKYEPGSDV